MASRLICVILSLVAVAFTACGAAGTLRAKRLADLGKFLYENDFFSAGLLNNHRVT
jgi:hypothetical protein